MNLFPTLVDPSKSNRRYLRIATPKGIWVSWQHDASQNVSRVRDLNIGGLFIETKTPPPVGASITLLFAVPEGEIRSSALVRNVTPGEGMGVQFVAMSQEHAVRLQTLFHSPPALNQCNPLSLQCRYPASDGDFRTNFRNLLTSRQV